MIKVLKISKTNPWAPVRNYHKFFDEKCQLTCEISSLNSVYPNLSDANMDGNTEESRKIDLNKLRLKGVRIQLEFYDSYSTRRDLQYQQSVPTILVLPNSEADINQLDYLIGSFAQEDFRVLAMKFPGEHLCSSSILWEK